jgi:energy-coupling factor transporter ATP-binding protein EcfA2
VSDTEATGEFEATPGAMPDRTKPHARVASAEFSDGTRLTFSGGDVVVFVGPNNAGKSAALRNIRELFQNASHITEVIKAIKLETSGSVDELVEWLPRKSKVDKSKSEGPAFQAFGRTINYANARVWWEQAKNYNQLVDLAHFFCCHVTSETRLTAANPAPAISMTREAKTHPTHFVFADQSIERRLSGISGPRSEKI